MTAHHGARLDFVQTGPARVPTHLSTVTLGVLGLVRVELGAPHVVVMGFDPASVYLTFPLDREPAAICNGEALRPDDVVLHGSGEPFHLWAPHPCHWGLIAIGRGAFARYGRALLGRKTQGPTSTHFPRMPTHALRDIRRLHAQTCRLHAVKPHMLARHQVARCLEQDLLHALIGGLGEAESGKRPPSHRKRADIMARFEAVLAAPGDRRALPALCVEIDVPERTLRHCCRTVVGCSPAAYATLRRLNRAHGKLIAGTPDGTTVASIAQSCGFAQLGRFAVSYRALFGESPSRTLHRAPSILAESA